ncbi:MAG: 50S ribosomal protein L17 [Patescibacteria group bacterium]|nr:50S ribosomal protein L17 [Patescibacteria group bacterium]
MKHLKKGRKFSREKKQREALLKIMLGDFLMKGKIRTTEAKAKEIKIKMEGIISEAKKKLSSNKNASLFCMRNLKAKLPQNITADKLKNIAQKYSKRRGGYVRIIKLGQRKSDGAKSAVIEMLKE